MKGLSLSLCSVHIWSIVTCGMLLTQAQAQSPLTNPDLDLQTDGTVNAVASQADGSVIVGGSFTSINGQPRRNLAKLTPSGALDSTWNPGADNDVKAIAVDNSTGAVYVMGFFSNVGSEPRNTLAKISGSGAGAVDPNWNPGSTIVAYNRLIGSLAVDGAGNVYVGGNSQNVNIGGQSRNYLARLSGTGTGAADATWNPNPDGSVLALLVDSSGNVYAGGNFQNIGGQSRNHIAKLSGSGSGAADAVWNPNADSDVSALATDDASAVYAAGPFQNIGGQPRNCLAKLSISGSGAADATWDPNSSGCAYTLMVGDAGQSLYAAGYFTAIGGQTRSQLAKLAASGAGLADATWNPGALLRGGGGSAAVYALAQGSGGNVIVGGRFQTIAGLTRRGLAVLSSTASLLPGTDAQSPGIVYALAARPGGGMVVGGDFNVAASLPRDHLLRLQADGSLDPIWNPGTDDPVEALTVDGNDNIYAGGYFRSVGGQYAIGLAKIDSNGSIDGAFTADCPEATALALDSNGHLFASGCINYSYSSDVLTMLSASTGAPDMTWNPVVSGEYQQVYALAVDNAHQQLYVGGSFSSIGGATLDNLARIPLNSNEAGNADATWAPNPDDLVGGLAVDSAGAVYPSGDFYGIGGQYFGGLAKITGADGAADPNWYGGSSCGYGSPLAMSADGVLFVGGSFTAFGINTCLHKALITDPGVDTSAWGAMINGFEYAIAVDTISGNVYVGGDFTAVAGSQRTGVAALAPTAPPIPNSERTVLLSLYNSTNGASWKYSTGWNGASGTECSWYGVTCYGGHVNRIYLDSNNLVGTLPAIAGLTELAFFSTNHNELNGSLPSLTGLTGLRIFNAAWNQFTGTVPALTGLARLQYFDVRYNHLSGSVPDLGDQPYLYSIKLGYNNLSGAVPTPASKYLLAGQTSLCPNALMQSTDSVWDNATGVTPWFDRCQEEVFWAGFE